MTWLIDRIIAVILRWLLDRGIRLGRQAKSDRAIDEQTREQAEALKKAATTEEFDDAAKDILGL